MKWIKGKYEFDWGDITTLLSVVAVIFTICGYGLIGTAIFIANCGFSIGIVIFKTKRINLLVLQIALLALNIYFLLQ